MSKIYQLKQNFGVNSQNVPIVRKNVPFHEKRSLPYLSRLGPAKPSQPNQINIILSVNKI